MNYRIIYRFIIFSISVTPSGLSCAIVDSKSQTYPISDVGEEMLFPVVNSQRMGVWIYRKLDLL